MVGLIVARSRNNVIGKNGEIPWKIKGEQKQFKELTTGNVVIMGRKSYEEIGHPLPNRLNIVVSNSKKFDGENLKTATSVEEAIKMAGDKDVFIAGGEGIYRAALPYVDVMYITEVDLDVEGGTAFFPEFDENEFDFDFGEVGGDDIKFARTKYVRRKTKKEFTMEKRTKCVYKNDIGECKVTASGFCLCDSIEDGSCRWLKEDNISRIDLLHEIECKIKEDKSAGRTFDVWSFMSLVYNAPTKKSESSEE